MISLIMPVFNAEETLQESLDSVLGSKSTIGEFIIVDDGSTDRSVEIVNNFKLCHPEMDIKVLQSLVNRGGGAARNIGILNSRFNYIFVLDSDDVLEPNSLENALKELIENEVDALATTSASIFTTSIYDPVRKTDYQKGLQNFSDLICHRPNPVIGNLLFTKTAFDYVGGYPENHGFDTQGFGFRLLRNNCKVLVGKTFFYHQRIPISPSYYVRETKSGNVNKNWFYILTESLYKFSDETRKYILEFDYTSPIDIARGDNIFCKLADMANSVDLINTDAQSLDDHQAYKKYTDTESHSLQMWCLIYEINNGFYQLAINRFLRARKSYVDDKIILHLIAKLLGTRLSEKQLEELSYFLTVRKSNYWIFRQNLQRIKNRLKRLCPK